MRYFDVLRIFKTEQLVFEVAGRKRMLYMWHIKLRYGFVIRNAEPEIERN